PQLRVARHRRAAATDAAAEGDGGRADDAAGRSGRGRAARLAFARLRSGRRRDLAPAVHAAAVRRHRDRGAPDLGAASRRAARPLPGGRRTARGLERRAELRRRARGGDDISPPRASGGRLATALAASALLTGLVVYPAVAGDRLVPLVIGVGVAGWFLFALGLLRWPALLGWGLGGFGAEYALFLRLR